jgi:hypothetical protein
MVNEDPPSEDLGRRLQKARALSTLTHIRIDKALPQKKSLAG